MASRSTISLVYLGTTQYALDVMLTYPRQFIRHIFAPGERLDVTNICDLGQLNANPVMADLLNPSRVGGAVFAVTVTPGVDLGGAVVPPPTQSDNVVYASPSGSDSGDGSLSAPVASFDRVLQLKPSIWSGTSLLSLAPGTYSWTSGSWNVGQGQGPNAGCEAVLGSFTNELGTRAASAGTTSTDIIDSSLASTIRSGSAASFAAGAGPQQSRITGLVGMLPSDVNRGLALRFAATAANNGYFNISNYVNATSVDVWNFNVSTTDANNGGIYWQESWEGGTISFSTGVAAGQRRMIRDHGVFAKGLITCVAVASLVDNDNFFVPDGIGAGTTFEYKVTGGFTPTGGRTTIDVSALTTAAQVAAATSTALNAIAKASLKVVALNTTGVATVTVVHMQLGTVGNVAITESVANAGFLVSGFSGGIGTALNTFSVNEPFVGTPGVGDSFQIEKPAVTITWGSFSSSGASTSSAILGNGAGLFMRGIRLLNASPALPTTALPLALDSVRLIGEGCEIACRGLPISASVGGNAGGLVGGLQSTVFIGPLIAEAQGTKALSPLLGGNVADSAKDPSIRPASLSLGSQVTISGGAIPVPRFQAGWFLHDSQSNGFQVQTGAQMVGYYILRNFSVVCNPVSYVNVTSLDAKRSNFTVSGRAYMQIASVATYGSRIDGTGTSAASGVVQCQRGSIFRINNATDISFGPSDGIRVVGASDCILLAALSGIGNGGNGILIQSESHCDATPSGATAATITGASGDMKVGLLATRLWSDFYANAPIGNQLDYKGDASRCSTLTTVASMP